MYLRGCTYGEILMVTCVRRHRITSHRASPSGLPRGPLRQKFSAYQGISLRLSHAAAAAGENQNHQQDIEPTAKDRQIRSTTSSLKLVTFEHAQHDLGVATRESWARERYADQIANFLPIEPTSQPKVNGSQWSPACYKDDKLFVNKVLKDKGLLSHDWRIALSALLEHTIFEKLDNPNDNDHVLSLFPNDGSHTQDLRGSNEDQSLVRRVPAYSRNYRYVRLARDISPPAEWSEANLAIYVEALAESQRTLARVPWAQKPQLKGWTNIGDVVTAFDTVFYGVASQPSLTIKACDAALRFFYDNGLLTKARALYIRMEDLRMPISTKTFNILLRGSASRMDLHNFIFLLKLMIRRGFKPNEVTWTLFLQMTGSSEARAVIVRKMTEMKMLDNIYTRRTVAKHMLPFEINNHLGNGHDHHSILDHMNSKYGSGWISTTAGNILLHEVAKYKSTAESLSLLYEMKQVGFEPDDISMATLLRRSLRSGQYDLAIEILDAFRNLYRLYPGPQAYEALFMQAWKKRRLNFSTVVWKYACIYGAMSTKIQYHVYWSLLAYTPALDKPVQSDDPVEPSNPNRFAKFKKFAGRFVIGLNSDEGAVLSQAMDTHERDPRRRTIKWARLLVRLSLRISRTCEVESGLSQMLRQALIMDNAWAVDGLYKEDDWRKRFPHAIEVPVRYLGKPPRRSRGSRKHVYHGGSAAAPLTQTSDLSKGLDGSKFVRLSPATQLRMKHSLLKSLRKAEPPAERRKRMRPIRPIRSKSPLVTLWRERLTREAARIRSRRGAKFKSYLRRV